jgi:hypothetical protein
MLLISSIIFHTFASVRLLQKLSLVNGVLFTGGSVKKGLYFETIKKVFQVLVSFTASVWFSHVIHFYSMKLHIICVICLGLHRMEPRMTRIMLTFIIYSYVVCIGKEWRRNSFSIVRAVSWFWACKHDCERGNFSFCKIVNLFLNFNMQI